MTSNDGRADTGEREEREEQQERKARKKVRRVRVIEVIDDEDLDEVLAALDEADEDEPPARRRPRENGSAARARTAEPEDDAEPAPARKRARSAEREEDAEPAPAGKRRSRGAELEEDAEPAPAGKRTRSAELEEDAEPAPAGKRSRSAELEEDAESAPARKRSRGAELEEDAGPAPARKRTRGAELEEDAGPAPARKRTRRVEPDADEEEPRPAGAGDDESVAAFRAAKARKAAAPSRPAALAASPRLTAALVTVLVVVLAVLLAWQWRTAGSLAAEQDERAAVAKVAGEYGNVAFSYTAVDYRQQIARNQRLLGGDLLATYNRSTAPNLGNVFGKNPQLVMSSKIKKVYVGDVIGDLATAVILVDIRLQTPEGANDGADTLLRLALKRESDGWKVTEQRASGQGDGDLTADLPTAPSTTPKPTPTAKD
ncbi:hypothetical protein DPM19_08770 [Actinomadura craniellae]|uniref:Mce-associated membrane protein n=1 Tax=Actinomadura craniellae TaxID=2231787 RepID=A0A365H9S7_9ACTN|nr:hypothetical protein [Actinomadura craniellae]RAY15847.1 hypothetical protein DPM19_08770 [Actinomadura craniellae]